MKMFTLKIHASNLSNRKSVTEASSQEALKFYAYAKLFWFDDKHVLNIIMLHLDWFNGVSLH